MLGLLNRKNPETERSQIHSGTATSSKVEEEPASTPAVNH